MKNVDAVLAAWHVKRRFGAVTALSDASISVRPGEIMALVGDNGAGKSTFLKILSGALAPDSGQIQLAGREVALHTPADSLSAGIETVYQDLALVDTLDAAENVFLGRELISSLPILRWLGVVSDKRMRDRVQDLIEELGANIPSLRTPVRNLSGGQRQSLAIARAVLWGDRVVILDEPTAALGVRESVHVLDVIRRLRDRGIGVILVSHNMQQVKQIADRVTVMRLGRTVQTCTVADTSIDHLVALITGATSAA